MPHQQARDYSTEKTNADRDAAARLNCDAPCCIRTSATREERKQESVMKLATGLAGRLLPDYEYLAGPQVGRQIGVVFLEVSHTGVVRLGDAAERLPFL